MALMTFFKIDGIPGDSKDKYHQGWFDVHMWGVDVYTLKLYLFRSASTAKFGAAKSTKHLFNTASIEGGEDGATTFFVDFIYLRVTNTRDDGRNKDGRLVDYVEFEIHARNETFGAPP